jgi:hypothetical protein
MTNRTYTQIESDSDTIYAAGPGLFVKSIEGQNWSLFKGPPYTAVSTNKPTALFAEDGNLAIGDRDSFAWRDSTGIWHTEFSTRWSNGTVLSIDYHGGYYWLGTDMGLVKIDPLNKSIVRYTREDGLAGRYVFRVIGEGDWLWLGTDEALIRFHWNVEGVMD